MTLDPEIREKVYGYFIAEAQDLLKEIEHDLLSFKEDHTPAKIHNLLRSVHTLKGGAASVGLDTIKNVAHVLEDIFTALRNPNITIDAEIETLLFQGYECLRSPLTAELTGGQIDDADVLNRAASVIAQIQMKLGDCFHQETELPTSADLGFDVVQQMFEIGVSQRLDDLQDILSESSDVTMIAAALQEKAEVFLGLAESLNLPGFGAIAKATLQALEQYPGQSLEIAQIAFMDFSDGKAAVLAGDRNQGGKPSAQLLLLSGGDVEAQFLDIDELDSPQPEDWEILEIVTTPNEESSGIELKTNLDSTQRSNQDRRLISAKELPPDPQNGVAMDWNEFIDTNSDLLSNVPTSETIELPTVSQIMNEEESPVGKNLGAELSLDELFGNYVTSDMPSDMSSDISPSDIPPSDIPPSDIPPSDVPSKVIRNMSGDIAEVIDEVQEESASQPITRESTESLISSVSQISENPSVISTDIAIQKEATSVADPVSSSVYSSGNSIHPTQFPVQTAEQLVMRPEASTVRPKPVVRSRDSINQTVRVELNQLERLNHLAGELLIECNQQHNQDDQHRTMVQVLLQRLRKFQQTMSALRDWSDRNYAKPELAAGSIGTGYSPPNSSPNYQSNQFLTGFDALEMDRYSELDFVLQSALEDSVQIESLVEAIEQFSKQLKRSARKQKQLLTHLRDDLTATRMQPLGELLNRFPRVLSQLSSAYNKPVELVLSGTDVLVDKAVVEKLYDPLLHLIRNGFDHGIEESEKRRSLHKPEKGRIEIRAFHQGNRTIIEIRDDGKGIDLQRVGQRAVEVGLISPHQLESLHPSQIFEFLFEPGFSTAAQVSDLSGRGVGLDVVRAQMQALNGTVTVTSAPNKGSIFSLQIPLSLTIIKLLVCQVNGIAYTLPVAAIEQIICPQVGQLEMLKSDRLVLHWQQSNQKFDIPVRHLVDLVHYSSSSSKLLGLQAQLGIVQNSPVLLVRTSAGLYGLQVDQVLGEQELVIRPVQSAIAPPDYVYGCCTLSDSRLALAVNVDVLLQRASEQDRISTHHRSTVQPSSSRIEQPQSLQNYPAATSTANRVLLIDDSLTLRQALALTLEKAEYQVAQAGDGSEALAYLRRHPGSINLIVCDVEMPRLNGFEFLSQVRHDPALAKIPVVMLTSRSGMKYRQLAQELGATAYLTKPYTDGDLLSHIAEVLHRKSQLVRLS
jgi:two-component system, chemotaxis family, sensor histidine kinase and response regulator PixL